MNITEEKIEKNYSLFTERLNKYGADISKLDAVMTEKMKRCPFGMSADTNTAYDGALLEIVLRQITPMALKIADLLEAQVNQESLIKVCLCHHLGKVMMYEPNGNEWEKSKRGLLYKFTNSSTSLKCGLRSVIFAQNLGIQFTEEEMEAMTVLDRSDDDASRWFIAPLSHIIKITNELIFVNNKFKMA